MAESDTESQFVQILALEKEKADLSARLKVLGEVCIQMRNALNVAYAVGGTLGPNKQLINALDEILHKAGI